MRILWIASVWPEPQSSAAGVRTKQLILALASGGNQVLVASACGDNEHRSNLEGLGVATVQVLLNDSSFDAVLQSYNPEVVIFDRFMLEEQFSWRVRALCPQAVRILDTVDLHSLRRVRQRIVEDQSDIVAATDASLSLAYPECPDTLREVASILRSDLTLLTSTFEATFLQDIIGSPLHSLAIVPLGYDIPPSPQPVSERKHFVWIGNGRHAPNVDSVRVLKDTIWPQLRSKLLSLGLDDVELHVYGAYLPAAISRLDDPETGFRILGWAEDAQLTLSKYRVSLAPLRFGAGIKGKILDGWQVGTPCVVTTIASEGMHDGLPFGGMVCEDWVTFVEAAVTLYQDDGVWEQSSTAGLVIMEQRYQLSSVAENFLAIVRQAYIGRDANRLRNVIGAVLWQQQLRSTEYFSRWIEAKNTVSIVGSHG